MSQKIEIVNINYECNCKVVGDKEKKRKKNGLCFFV